MAEHWHNAHALVERRREPQYQTLAIIRSQYNQLFDRITAGGNANSITLKTHAPAFFAGGGLANRQLGIMTGVLSKVTGAKFGASWRLSMSCRMDHDVSRNRHPHGKRGREVFFPFFYLLESKLQSAPA